MRTGVLASCLAALALALAACAAPAGAREDEIASVFADADLPLIRERPLLVAGKYARMASAPFEFYRGELPLFLHDWVEGANGLAASRFTAELDPEPLSLGDPHPENFGLLEGPDGSFALEPNDFDSADRGPYLWDVRRLVVGLALAAHVANADDPAAQAISIGAARDVARAAAAAYATEIAALASGAARPRFDDPNAGLILAHLFGDAQQDLTPRAELTDDTVVSGSERRMIRGVLDPSEPTQAFEDLPADAIAALPATLAAYRRTLLAPPDAGELRLVDAVREFGSGVASWPRVRIIAIVRGASRSIDEDVLLEVKELADSELPPAPPPGVWFDSIATRDSGVAAIGARVTTTSRAAWFTPDAAPLWGASTLLGLPVQVRLESAAQHTVRTDKFTGKKGTPEEIEAFAATLGQVVARAHASPLTPGETPAQSIAALIGGDVDGFADEQADLAVAYEAQVESDFADFSAALTALGPRLGVPVDANDAPPPDLAALYGTPPEAEPALP